MGELYICNTAALSNPAVFAQKLHLLSNAQQEKILSLRKAAGRNLSLGGLLLLRTALLQRGISEFAIRKNAFGKPYLEKAEGVFFNISHSGQYAVCAVGGSEVGADIEKLREVDLRVARRFFSAEEFALLQAQEEAQKQETFFRIWTLKESFLKALGTGMHTALNSFSIALGPGGKGPASVLCRNGAGGKPYFFQEYALEGYKIAVCSEKADFPGHFIYTAV